MEGSVDLKKIIISRTDSLGDVVLTLPLAGFLKQNIPGVQIIFIGRTYTRALIESCIYVDEFVEREKFIQHPGLVSNKNTEVIIFAYPDIAVAKAAVQAGVSCRIGTSHRWFHWWYCNQLVSFSRRNADLHESQLNFKLLKPFAFSIVPAIDQISQWYGLQSTGYHTFSALEKEHRFKLIIHPKSKGSSREWPLKNYLELIKQLSSDNIKVYVTGTVQEGELIKNEMPEIFDFAHVQDTTGQYTLEELMHFIERCDALIACSTGPLHIAAALGKPVVGIYPPMRPLHAGRWGPVGQHASVLALDKTCNACKGQHICACIEAISPARVRTCLMDQLGLN